MKKEKCLAIIVSLLVIFSVSACARLKNIKNEEEEVISIYLSAEDVENIRKALDSNYYELEDEIERCIEETSWVNEEGLSMKVITVFPYSMNLVGGMEMPEDERLIYIALNAQGEPGCRKAFLQVNNANGGGVSQGVILACKKDGRWNF